MGAGSYSKNEFAFQRMRNAEGRSQLTTIDARLYCYCLNAFFWCKVFSDYVSAETNQSNSTTEDAEHTEERF
jgi:hypothetical protein